MINQSLEIFALWGIVRIIKMVESRQSGRCISCKEPITKDHAVVSRGRPSYYHKDCAIKHNII